MTTLIRTSADRTASDDPNPTRTPGPADLTLVSTMGSAFPETCRPASRACLPPWSPCFAAGTRIATVHGEIAVDNLRVDDTVVAVLGDDTEPIIWIGRRHIDCTRHPQPHRVWPVRLSAGALGVGLPYTDLLLSPDHAIYFNKVLIPVKHLINDSTIVQFTMDRITYYHIELRQHDVVLAHGLPVESLLELRDRSNYANGHGPMKLHPDFSSRMWEARGCAPLVVAGPELEAARAVVRAYATKQSGVA